MKKEVKKIVSVCDDCGRDLFVLACLGCGREYCLNCRSNMGHAYDPAVHSGSGAGYFCNICDNNPPEKVKKLHQSYRRIQSLQKEEKEWRKDFAIRCETADEALEMLVRDMEDIQECTKEK